MKVMELQTNVHRFKVYICLGLFSNALSVQTMSYLCFFIILRCLPTHLPNRFCLIPSECRNINILVVHNIIVCTNLVWNETIYTNIKKQGVSQSSMECRWRQLKNKGATTSQPHSQASLTLVCIQHNAQKRKSGKGPWERGQPTSKAGN